MRMSQCSSGLWKNWDIMMTLLKTMVLVLGAFIICWISGLVLFYWMCCPWCNVLDYERFSFLAEFNYAMNPISYSYQDKEILCLQHCKNTNGPKEGSDCSASSLTPSLPESIAMTTLWFRKETKMRSQLSSTEK